MSEDQLAADIEASLNTIPFDPAAIDTRRDPSFLSGTCQFTLTGLASWLCTFREGVHSCVRCPEETCVPPPDAKITLSPETYLAVLRRERDMNAETALHQGLIVMEGDWSLALAIVGESF